MEEATPTPQTIQQPQRQNPANVNIIASPRPYSVVIPFAIAFTGTNNQVTVWEPKNATFEFAGMELIASVGSVDFALCDTEAANIFAYIMAATTSYTPLAMPNGSYRSHSLSSRLILNNLAGAVVNVKGVIFGWEITQEGYVR